MRTPRPVRTGGATTAAATSGATGATAGAHGVTAIARVIARATRIRHWTMTSDGTDHGRPQTGAGATAAAHRPLVATATAVGEAAGHQSVSGAGGSFRRSMIPTTATRTRTDGHGVRVGGPGATAAPVATGTAAPTASGAAPAATAPSQAVPTASTSPVAIARYLWTTLRPTVVVIARTNPGTTGTASTNRAGRPSCGRRASRSTTWVRAHGAGGPLSPPARIRHTRPRAASDRRTPSETVAATALAPSPPRSHFGAAAARRLWSRIERRRRCTAGAA